ncbi:MAG: UDP-N-acetylglucosamine 4,6-dehydratase family protein [Burkholderiales bacterium]|nr:UDP-N-acetylglucosamine 4,6-dehydratase family protein [Burkholderiales bacterium]
MSVLAVVAALSGSLWLGAAGWIVAGVACVALAEYARRLRTTKNVDSAPRPKRPTPIVLVDCAAERDLMALRFDAGSDWCVVASCVEERFTHEVRRSGAAHACVSCLPASHEQRRDLLERAAELGVTLWLPESERSNADGRNRLRKWRIDDVLLCNAVDSTEMSVRELLAGKVVLVTGAGGSIGGELCRQIAAQQPSLIILFEQSEYALYSIEQQLGDQFPQLPTVAVIGDVKSETRVNDLMRRYQPAVVFHAAAYKHVPLMEDCNAWEALRNNVLGTYVLARAAINHAVDKFVLVSTDKAVNPTNVMGASKRLAEMVCQALQQTTSLPRFEMVRFGNVLGSAGSVIPRFEEQIAKGGPVTVTHPDMVRYFMSIPEAARLVLQAGSMGLGGEIFVMDMGKPIRILNLAQDMIRLSGHGLDRIPIDFSGLRPGEKLFEELLLDGEQTRATPHPRLRVAKAREVPANWLPGLLEWMSAESEPDEHALRRDLKKWVPEYATPIRPQLRAVGGGRAPH